MNLPTSDQFPEEIQELPPARQRHIRRRPRSAGPAERMLLFEDLQKLTATTFNFFIRGIFGLIAIGIALFFDEPVLLILSLALFPPLNPIFRMALVPINQKFNEGLKALASLLILMGLTLLSGMVAGWLRKAPSLETILSRFSAPYWLDILIVAVASLLAVLILVRRGENPKSIGILLAFEIFVPLTAVGFAFISGIAGFIPNALLVSLLHLGLSISVGMLTLLILGFPPKRSVGWLLLIITILLTLAALSLGMHFASNPAAPISQHSPTGIPSAVPTHTTRAKTVPTTTATNTHTPSDATLTPTLRSTLTASPSLTISPTPEPTTFMAVIDSINGVVIRETPSDDALVISYANNGETIEVLDTSAPEGTGLWYHVRTANGDTGWLLSALVNTQTPTPED